RCGHGERSLLPCLGCQLQQFLDIQGVQFVVENKEPDDQEDVADPGYHEGFHGRYDVSWMAVIETDQQVTAKSHAFPAEVQKQQVVGQYQTEHAGHKQVHVGKKAVVALLASHVPGSEQMDKKADAGDHAQHGQG